MYARALGLVLLSMRASAQYSATYTPWNAPDKTETGQSGTNKCGTTANQSSMCQNAYINSVDDFCLWAPPQPGPGSVIGNTEQIEVAWCMKDGYGTRLIPDGTISGVHFVKTPDFVQVTGVGDLTKLNIPAGDEGGELDPHGADSLGNPVGGLVFSSAFGRLEQIHEWTNFMAADEFCFRACDPAGNNPAEFCQHIYDVMGCHWNMPANYDAGTFESCDADSGAPMGVYGASTFHQGDAATPDAHPIPSSSKCSGMHTVANGQATAAASTTTTASTKPTSTATTSTVSSVATSSLISMTAHSSSSPESSVSDFNSESQSSLSSGNGSNSAAGGNSTSTSRLSNTISLTSMTLSTRTVSEVTSTRTSLSLESASSATGSPPANGAVACHGIMNEHLYFTVTVSILLIMSLGIY